MKTKHSTKIRNIESTVKHGASAIFVYVHRTLFRIRRCCKSLCIVSYSLFKVIRQNKSTKKAKGFFFHFKEWRSVPSEGKAVFFKNVNKKIISVCCGG